MASDNLWNTRAFNYVWRYFTQKEWPMVECNFCANKYSCENITNLENHLSCKHPEKVKEMLDKIKSAWVSKSFIFDEKHANASCIICRMEFNIFRGIFHLRDHLFVDHKIVEPEDTSSNPENSNASSDSTDEIEDNANITTDNNQQAGSRLQNAKYQESQDSDHLAWRFFTPTKWPWTTCNMCGRTYSSINLFNLEQHLSLRHPKVIKEIQDEMKGTKLSKFFTFGTDHPKIAKCTCNKEINIFYGTNKLKQHLIKIHNLVDFDANEDTNADDPQASS